MSGTQPARSSKTRQASGNGARTSVNGAQRARRRHAQEAERKIERRRRKQTGVAGWVSDRASEWSLDGPDWEFLERQKYFWNPLMDYWFRM
ncbi:MAG: hypothetical protein ACXVXL_02365, partial [Solirubrobacteraceae bacterium]